MTHTDWHVPDDLLRRFTDDPAAIDDPTASSLEAHLVACAHCRLRLVDASPASDLDASWNAIADHIDRPASSLVERLLERLGVGDGMARLLAATPALRLAGLGAVVVLAAGAVLVSRSTDAEGPFLVLAPLVPLLMVALSFATVDDPATEAGVATPLYGAGLVVRRACAALVVTFVVLGIASLALPDLGPEAATWVLPALALTLASFSLATWMPTAVSVAVLAVSWLTTVSVVRWSAGRELAYGASPTFSLSGQLTAGAIALVSAALFIVRRDRFASMEALR